MKQELIKCSCCDEMVPADDMELTYRLPDAIACMSQEDIDETCKCTSDYVICEERYFYVRCVIVLPIKESARDYAIGAWAQVSPKSFNRIWDLWDEDDQSQEPPMRGLLANSVHLNQNAEDAEIEVQLTGASSRPKIVIKDPECTLYAEQSYGISMHRAREYSELCH